jgi:hypothetical protein
VDRFSLLVDLSLIGYPVTLVRFAVTHVGTAVAVAGLDVPKAGGPITLVGDAVTLVGGPVTLVGSFVTPCVQAFVNAPAVLEPILTFDKPVGAMFKLELTDGGSGIALLRVDLALVGGASHVRRQPGTTNRLSGIVRRHPAAAVRLCRCALGCREPPVPLGMLAGAGEVLRQLISDTGTDLGRVSDGIRGARQRLLVFGQLGRGFGHPVARLPFLVLLHMVDYSPMADPPPSGAARDA